MSDHKIGINPKRPLEYNFFYTMAYTGPKVYIEEDYVVISYRLNKPYDDLTAVKKVIAISDSFFKLMVMKSRELNNKNIVINYNKLEYDTYKELQSKFKYSQNLPIEFFKTPAQAARSYIINKYKRSYYKNSIGKTELVLPLFMYTEEREILINNIGIITCNDPLPTLPDINKIISIKIEKIVNISYAINIFIERTEEYVDEL